jgi:hypothetical protein
VIKALNKLKKKKGRLNYHKMKIQNALEAESRTYFELLSMKMVQRTDIPNNILIISLKEKMDQATERLFRLAGLMHDQQDIYGSYLALRSSDEDAQAASVEFVDNVLKTEEKKYITPIIDTLDEEEKMAKGRKLFEIPVEDYEEAMLNLMEGEDIWLRACAIFSVSATCPDSLQDHVKQSAAGDEYSELVQETATYVLERNSED